MLLLVDPPHTAKSPGLRYFQTTPLHHRPWQEGYSFRIPTMKPKQPGLGILLKLQWNGNCAVITKSGPGDRYREQRQTAPKTRSNGARRCEWQITTTPQMTTTKTQITHKRYLPISASSVNQEQSKKQSGCRAASAEMCLGARAR